MIFSFGLLCSFYITVSFLIFNVAGSMVELFYSQFSLQRVPYLPGGVLEM